MAEDEQKNMLKYSNYRNQSARLKQVLADQFYFEALFIEYAVMEDRLMSCFHRALKYLRLSDEKLLREFEIKGLGAKCFTLEKIITDTLNEKRSGMLPEDAAQCFKACFDGDLLKRLFEWCDKRNKLVHALMLQKITVSSLKQTADAEYELMKAVKSCAGKCNRALDKLNRGKADL